ncbi:multicopper oxidase family protein [Streptomyces sp. SCSIO 30461]|uniref:multicopper oxidase family protein n=1 Tax=Streptomyces sp. SCSIO 30461 TaxID=3118085 RepID=UPI0030D1D1AA
MYRQEQSSDLSHTRRAVLCAGIAAAGSELLSGCSGSPPSRDHHAGAPGAVPARSVPPPGGESAAPAAEQGHGRATRRLIYTATASTVDLGGGHAVRTWTYNGEVPARPVRITTGDTLEMTLNNHLPESTTVHWHGLAVRNDMDGVPNVTQRPIRSGASFTYRFRVPHPGTYWFHPHLGLQLDRGLYAPLIVEDPREPLSYDREWVVMLDDWVDGVNGASPAGVFAQLRGDKPPMGHGSEHRSGHSDGHERPPSGARPPRPVGGVDAGYGPPLAHAPGQRGSSAPPDGGDHSYRLPKSAVSRLLGGPSGHIAYPHYLVNGRTADHPAQFRARPGERIRLRIINAGAETPFRVALGGHRLTITHCDGFPVQHHTVDSLLLGMAERYDALVTVKDGVFPLTALAEGKRGAAMAVLRTGRGASPTPSVRPAELYRDVLVSARRLRPHDSVAMDRRRPDRRLKLTLTGGMQEFDWGIDHKPYSPDRILKIERGERVRLTVINATDMWHPVHLHGHTYALAGTGTLGARKDTSVVLPHRKLVFDMDADNPGLWMLHCHNVYHSESGMMTTLGYR